MMTWPKKWTVHTYRNEEARVVHTDALGPVEIPAGFEWQVGAKPFVLPDALVSDDLKEAACVHDVLYSGPRTGARLYRVDRALIEVFWRVGGSAWLIPVIWPAVRFWAWRRAEY